MADNALSQVESVRHTEAIGTLPGLPFTTSKGESDWLFSEKSDEMFLRACTSCAKRSSKDVGISRRYNPSPSMMGRDSASTSEVEGVKLQ